MVLLRRRRKIFLFESTELLTTALKFHGFFVFTKWFLLLPTPVMNLKKFENDADVPQARILHFDATKV